MRKPLVISGLALALSTFGCAAESDEEGEAELLGTTQQAASIGGVDWPMVLGHNPTSCIAVTQVTTHTPVIQKRCGTLPDRWTVTSIDASTVGLRVYGYGQCLDRPWNRATTHTQLQLFPCHYDAAQQWRVRRHSIAGQGTFWQLEAPGTNQCLDVATGGVQDGLPIQMYPCKPAGDPTLGNQLIRAPWR